VEVTAIKRTALFILDEEDTFTEPAFKLDLAYSSPDVSFLVMYTNINGTFDFVESVLNYKVKQHVVSLELRKEQDCCMMMKPTYGVRDNTYPCSVFRFGEQELCAYLEDGIVEVNITIVARDTN